MASVDVTSRVCCLFCGKQPPNLYKCARCLDTHYCDRACQKKDWSVHKLLCGKFNPANRYKFTQFFDRLKVDPIINQIIESKKINKIDYDTILSQLTTFLNAPSEKSKLIIIGQDHATDRLNALFELSLLFHILTEYKSDNKLKLFIECTAEEDSKYRSYTNFSATFVINEARRLFDIKFSETDRTKTCSALDHKMDNFCYHFELVQLLKENNIVVAIFGLNHLYPIITHLKDSCDIFCCSSLRYESYRSKIPLTIQSLHNIEFSFDKSNILICDDIIRFYTEMQVVDLSTVDELKLPEKYLLK